ncbi:MAG: DinG family ATP-dependent helicase [Moraxellaceae bacterium]|jgi:DNA excision repair protein ERCC-2|nr:DinG family ATP-dependent helicase [Moraxellaceae bacterium]
MSEALVREAVLCEDGNTAAEAADAMAAAKAVEAASSAAAVTSDATAAEGFNAVKAAASAAAGTADTPAGEYGAPAPPPDDDCTTITAACAASAHATSVPATSARETRRKPAAATPVFTIAVRELCEFTAKAGDLDRRFTPAPTAEEGREGHRVVASRRGPGYRSEVPLRAEFGALRLRGRADGYDPAQGLLEEVKTHRGSIARIPENQRALHWAQAKLYGAMLCAQEHLDELNIAIVYFDVGDQKETPVLQAFTARELQEFLEEQCTRFLRWAEQEMAHRRSRDASLTALQFPHPEFRHGQRLLAEGVYRTARDGGCLMAQAPTGIGKTIGTIFPVLKAMPGQQLDRLFFLTAKTPGRALALEAAQRLQHADPALRLRVLELTARDKACVHPDKECHGESCPLAKGFYDRLPAARAAAVALSGARRCSDSADNSDYASSASTIGGGSGDNCKGSASGSGSGNSCSSANEGGVCVGSANLRDNSNRSGNVSPDEREGSPEISALLDQPALQRLAATHQVCPYYLSQELARWSDVVVGDYNYFFDGSALLHALTLQRDWKVAVLCDEAHNLIERAREMYSAELNPAQLAALRKTLPRVLKRPLSRLQSAWDELHETGHAYETRDTLPATFVGALQGAIAKIADYQAEHPLEVNPELLRFYFDAVHFQDLLECLGLEYRPTPESDADNPAPTDAAGETPTPGAPRHGEFQTHVAVARDATPVRHAHSFIDITTPPPGRGARLLRIRNVIPAPFLAPRIAACHALTLFSATLTPPELYRNLLGLPRATRFLDVPSPFAADQLAVRLVDRISTRYQHREASLLPIAELMAAQYAQTPGNYLAFFSSHDYLQRALAVFRERFPEIPVREQARAMSEAERTAFLAGFGVATKGIAFAVLGGAFGEGIDLPGERLIGAFVATLGLPQVNEMNEKIRELLQAQFGAGYDYTYLYPGLQKVVQAAGRVIRTQQDRGVIYLIDDRFLQGKVRALLPGWWAPARMDRQQ